MIRKCLGLGAVLAGLQMGFADGALADPVQLPIDADRCAITRALVGAPVAGCDQGDPMADPAAVLRSLGQDLPGAQTGGYYVHFDFDSRTLDMATQAHLQRLTMVLNGNLADLCILLVGHTDTVGAASYNQGLSEKRAGAVRLYLVGPGQVLPGRIQTEGMGEMSPLPDRMGEDPMNRRVEILAKRSLSGSCS